MAGGGLEGFNVFMAHWVGDDTVLVYGSHQTRVAAGWYLVRDHGRGALYPVAQLTELEIVSVPQRDPLRPIVNWRQVGPQGTTC